jgi:hypothetical protein
MSAAVIPFPDTIGLPPIPPGARPVRADVLSWPDTLALRHVAEMLRADAQDMRDAAARFASVALAESLEAWAERRVSDRLRLMDEAAVLWGLRS